MNRIPIHTTRPLGAVFLVVAPAALLVLVSCGLFTGSLDQEENSPEREIHETPAADTVRLSSSVLQKHNIELVQASIESLQDRIRTPGVVRPNDRRVVRVRALARIDHRFGNEGDFGRPERFSESFAIDPVQVE